MAIAAIGQICSTASMAHNLQQCRILISKAAAAGAKALFLPEASDYIGSNAAETVSLAKPVSSSEFVLGLQQEARRARLAINVGVHEPVGGAGEEGIKKVKNTLLWIDEKGEITQRYQKLHLFDVEIENGPVLKESQTVQKGTTVHPPFPCPSLAGARIGLMICYDLRFPELSTTLRLHPSPPHILTYPSAFTIPTGKAHWAPLLRARAIETQSYVFAAAQCGPHNEAGTRASYGHSMVVGPWGDVIAELGGWEKPEPSSGGGQELTVPEPDMAIVHVDLDAVERIRREMPLLRRTDVYSDLGAYWETKA